MNKVFKNYFYNLFYQLLLIILPIITTPYISRVLGASKIGAYSYTNSITQYFILFGCIGLNLYGQREIAYCQENVEKRTKTFYELIAIRTITLSISLLVFFNTMVLHSGFATLFAIQIIDIVASMFDISWFFQGMEDFRRTVIRNFFVRIICVILIFVFVKSPSDIYIYVLCYSGTLILGNISLWFYMPKYITKLRVSSLEIKHHIKPAVMLFLPQIATSLYTLLDKTMIGLLTNDTSEVAYYQQSQTIIKTVMTVITSLGVAMMPRIANLFSNNNKEEIKKYMGISIKFVLICSIPFCAGIIAVTPGFVPWFYGDGFNAVIPNMIIISPIIIFIGMSNVMGTQYLIPTGRQKEFTISVVGGSCVNIILNVLLIPLYNSVGAAVATVVAEFVVMIIQAYFLRNEFDFKIILKDLLKYSLFSLIMFVSVSIIALFFSKGIISTLIEMLFGMIVYCLLLIITKDAIFKTVTDKLKSVLR